MTDTNSTKPKRGRKPKALTNAPPEIVLANEEVDEWKEKGYTVERRPMRQWMIRITKYADRLLNDLELVEWPVSTKEMQKH